MSIPVTATGVKTYLSDLGNKFIMKPKNAKGIGGFVFDVEAEADVVFRAEITDHYLEDATTVQDHIAVKPEIITLRGYIGELVDTPPGGILGAINGVQNRLTAVQAYLGHYTPTQLKAVQAALTKAQDITQQVSQAINRAQNIVGFFNTTPAPTNQQKAYTRLKALVKQIFSVETPYNFHKNMALEVVALHQGEDSKYISDISVTLKEIRTVDSDSESSDPNLNRNAQQGQAAVNKGKTSGTTTAFSVLTKAFSTVQGVLR